MRGTSEVVIKDETVSEVILTKLKEGDQLMT